MEFLVGDVIKFDLEGLTDRDFGIVSEILMRSNIIHYRIYWPKAKRDFVYSDKEFKKEIKLIKRTKFSGFFNEV